MYFVIYTKQKDEIVNKKKKMGLPLIVENKVEQEQMHIGEVCIFWQIYKILREGNNC